MLHLGEGGHDPGDGLADGCGEVNSFTERPDDDSALVQVVERLQDMDRGPAKPVEGGTDNDISGPSVIEQGIEARPVRPGTTHHVRKDTIHSACFEGIELLVEVLLRGRHSDIAELLNGGRFGYARFALSVSHTNRNHRSWRVSTSQKSACHRVADGYF